MQLSPTINLAKFHQENKTFTFNFLPAEILKACQQETYYRGHYCYNCKAITPELPKSKVYKQFPEYTKVFRSRNNRNECPCAKCGIYIRYTFNSYNFRKFKNLSLDDYECVYCGSKEDLTLDHVIPKSKGGKTEANNLVTACKTCNFKKSDSLEIPPRLYGRFRRRRL